MKVIVALFDHSDAAEQAVYELLDHGIAVDHINAVCHLDPDEDPRRGPAHHTGLGCVLVDAGFLDGPELGTVLAVGPRLGPLAFPGEPRGAGLGVLTRRLHRIGVPMVDAEGYVEAVERGAALVVLTVYDAYVDDAAEILMRHEPIEPDETPLPATLPSAHVPPSPGAAMGSRP
ncbi:hypothetical protein [Paraliomyxa miuraensis]|uniref:hypothetical protein n=1 Tax=Paraliomyxa miuraensis TaxID=376150 RepID=UPI00224D3359|nr:hypothetical protein [Paraliomyxa miuraensis]MCX4240370.1 hypothetical protein [Paraliomyxa miuraensis]